MKAEGRQESEKFSFWGYAMKRTAAVFSFLFFMSALFVSVIWVGLRAGPPMDPNPDAALQYWPQWRGPEATGVSADGNPPVEWSEEKNIKWKVEIPGKGSSSPIVWKDRIYLTTAVPTGEVVEPKPSQDTFGSRRRPEGSTGSRPEGRTGNRAGAGPGGGPGARAGGRPGGGRRRRGPRGILVTQAQKFILYALDRESGKIVWERTLKEGFPHEGTHNTGTWASNSPSTDGERIYAFFGSHGLYCLDMKGNLVWEKDFGDLDIRLDFGEGASPFLYGDKIIVNWDHEGPSFIAALDKKTGKEIWRTERDEGTSWATPLVVPNNGGHQVVTNATAAVRGYDLADGKLLWQIGGMTNNTIPSPVAADGMVYVTSGFRGNALYAIRLDGAKGNLTGSESIAWSLDRDTPYAPSPLLYQNTLYFLKRNSGVFSSFNAKTGEQNFGPVRLEAITSVYSSPVGAAGRVYVTSREGTTVVLEHGAELKVLATNTLEDGFDASMAVVDKEIYLRGQKYLYRISEN